MERLIGWLVIVSWIILFGGAESRAMIAVLIGCWYVVIAVVLACGVVRYLRSGSQIAVDEPSDNRL